MTLVSAKTGEGVNEAMRALAKIIFLRASEMRAAMKAPAAPTQAQSSQKFSLFKKPKETRAENAEPRVVPSPSQQRPNQNGELRLKICFVGDTLTGAKTSFVNRYVHKTFSQDTAPTIGAKFDTKEVVSRGVTVHLDIWDTAGQERYRSLIPMYLINCNRIVVGYDITSKESLQVAGNRYSDLKARYPNAVIMVIGNKTDLEHNRRVSLEEGEVLTNAIRASIFFESKKIYTYYIRFYWYLSHLKKNHCVCVCVCVYSLCKDRSKR